MLNTPLGKLRVYKNDIEIDYELKELPNRPIDICEFEVDCRFLIEINREAVRSGDIISYKIDTNVDCSADGGDCLVEAMFEEIGRASCRERVCQYV